MARRRRRLGLRARITVIYALGALLVTSSFAFGTFVLTQQRLLNQTETAARAQMFRNARDLRTALAGRTDPESLEAAQQVADDESATEAPDLIATALVELPRINRAGSLLEINNEQRSPSSITRADLPQGLVELVDSGQAAEQRYEHDGQVRYAVGVRIDELDANYYEILTLTELSDTLSSLQVVLGALSLVTALAAAALGFLSARRLLFPVEQVSAAAEAIAAGDFATRLDTEIDPDLGRLSTSFNDMVDALRDRIERDERFASDVSHELRSPLMTLTASIEVLERRAGDMAEPAARAVELLGQDVRRFQRLVEDLLEMSRIGIGSVGLDRTDIDLPEFLAQVVAASRTPGVAVVGPLGTTSMAIHADKRRLAQVVTNLLDNAQKYGGGAVAVRYRRTGPTVRLMVDDAGPGVPDSEKELIFDRFSRSKADASRRGHSSGFGLGLALAAEHVRLHGGRIWVQDRPGGPGARFVIELPDLAEPSFRFDELERYAP